MKNKFTIIILFILTCMSGIYSQEIDLSAKCVKDLYKNKDTLNIVLSRNTCDSIFFYKIQMYNSEKGLLNKMFVDLKIKKPKNLISLKHYNLRNLNFKKLCISGVSYLDYNKLVEYETKIRKCVKKNHALQYVCTLKMKSL